MLGFCYDIESNGFYDEADKIWTICLKDLKDPSIKLKLNPFLDSDWKIKFIQFMKQYKEPLVVFHNGLKFDQLVLRKFGVDFSVGPDTIEGYDVVFLDTLYLSQYINPDEDGHGIEAWGERLGLEKIDYRTKAIELGLIEANAPKGAEFMQHHPEMDVYCDRDVDVNIKVFWNLWSEFKKQYKFGDQGEIPGHYRIAQKNYYLMGCQAITGWQFDIDLGKQLVDKINTMMLELEQEVEPKLPPRKLKKSEEKEYTMPMKPFKKDGTFSSHMLNFIEKHKGEIQNNGSVSFYGVVYPVKSQLMLEVSMPMKLGNQDDIKDWLLETGWKPTFYNFKRGPDGKPERAPNGKLIPTSPKMQDTGKICPNLMAMEGDIVPKIVKWLSLRNRLSVLTGWLEHPRLKLDGRLPTNSTGSTPTHREKHSVVVNVPKASDKVLLGKEFRSLFIARKDRVIAAGDAAALEGRVMAHYTFKYDNGATAEELLSGDPHSKNAKAFFPVQTEKYDIYAEGFSKDDPGFKPYRDRSKNGFYAVLYGAGPPKLASTLGLPESDGNRLYDAFWEANPATASLKGNVEKFWNNDGKKKWLPGIDGRRIYTRKKSALLNSLFQSCGAIAMQYAICFMDEWLGGIVWEEDQFGTLRPCYRYKGYYVGRIGYYHDELEYECDEQVAEEVSKMIEKAIEKAGVHLKLKVPLAGEGKVGINWCQVH